MKNPDSQIHYVFRNKGTKFNSIEAVFDVVIPQVGRHMHIKRIHLPSAYASPESVRKNLRQIHTRSSTTLYHITGHVNYMALKTGRMTVLTIHDIRSALGGNIFARMAKLIFWFWIPALIVKRITVISEFSRTELRKLVPFTARKTVVIPNPVHPYFTNHPVRQYGFPKGTDERKLVEVLLMGTKPNKNLERTLEALKELPVTLTIVGDLKISQKSLLNKIGLEYENHNDLPHKKLVQCYQEVDLLCFPSTYEGFGMPIIEAQATGRPVVTSNLGAMKEVAGDSACLVDPYDVSSIKEGVIKVIEDEAYRSLLVERGLENVKRFKAEAVAEQYMEVYREVFGHTIEEMNE